MADPWTPLPSSGPRIDEPFESDLPCRSCGYNLRGLVPSGRCPECGTAIGFSLHGDLLKYSDPNWVETLAGGMIWIIAGLVVGLVLGIAVGVSGAPRNGSLVTAATIASYLVSLVGYWKVTTPDPSKTKSAGLNLRLVARYGWIAASVLNAVESAVNMQQSWAETSLLLFSQIANCVSTVGICLYAADLARRIPRQSLARQTHTVMWGSLVLEVVCAILFLLVTATLGTTAGAPSAGGTASSIAAVGLSCFAIIGGLIFGIWAIVLLVKYHKALTQAAAQARTTWAAHAAEGDRAEVTKDGAERNAVSVE